MAQKNAPGAMVTVGVPMSRKTKDKLKTVARAQGMPLATWLRHLGLKAAEDATR